METWLLFAIGAYFCYAISSSLDKYFMKKKHHPALTNTFKMFFDGTILLIIGLLFFDLHFSWELIGWAFALGGLYAVSGICYFSALHHKDVDIVIPYAQSAVILLTFIAALFLFKEPATGSHYFGVGLILCGMYIILSNKFRLPTWDAGSGFMVGLVIAEVLYLLLAKNVLTTAQPIVVGITMYYATTIILIGYHIVKKDKVNLKENSKIAISALFAAVGTLLLYTALQQGISSRVYAIAGLQAAFVFLLAWIFLHDRFHWHRLVGTVIVVLGIFLVHI